MEPWFQSVDNDLEYISEQFESWQNGPKSIIMSKELQKWSKGFKKNPRVLRQFESFVNDVETILEWPETWKNGPKSLTMTEKLQNWPEGFWEWFRIDSRVTWDLEELPKIFNNDNELLE